MSRPFWHWQAGLEVAVDTARHQLDHAVRVEMKLATARAWPGHHIPRFCSPSGLAARRAASPAHRSQTSYTKCATNACLSLVDRGARRREYQAGMPTTIIMPPCRHTVALRYDSTYGHSAIIWLPYIPSIIWLRYSDILMISHTEHTLLHTSHSTWFDPTMRGRTSHHF